MAGGMRVYTTREAAHELGLNEKQFRHLLAVAGMRAQKPPYDGRCRIITHEQFQRLVPLRDQVVKEPLPLAADEVTQLRALLAEQAARLAAIKAGRSTIIPSPPDSAAPTKARPLPEGWVPAHRWLCESVGLSGSKARRWLVQYAHLREHGWWANGVEYALTLEQQTAFRRLAGVSDTASGGRENRQAR